MHKSVKKIHILMTNTLEKYQPLRGLAQLMKFFGMITGYNIVRCSVNQEARNGNISNHTAIIPFGGSSSNERDDGTYVRFDNILHTS
jgi:hypothetical protein